MKIEFLKIFCDVIDVGSLSRAAALNGLSQPAVSQQLAKLEQTFGTPLISRSGGLPVPTQAGTALYERAREILRHYERMFGEVRSAAAAISGALRVGTIYSVGFYLLNTCIRQFLQAHPEVNLQVEYTHWSRIYANVIGGEMDLGVVAYPEKQRLIEIIPFTSEELVVTCPPEHRFAKKDRIDPSELAGEPFVAFAANIPTRRNIDRTLRSQRVRVDVVMEFDNIETLKRAIEVGAGVSILPSGNIGREVADGRLCRARFADRARWMRPLGIVRHRGSTLSPAASMFLRLLRIHR